VIVPLWLASVGWLVAHDVWPGFTARSAPTLQVTDWLKEAGKNSQFAIFNDVGRLGTMWTTHLIDEQSVLRTDLLWIEGAVVDLFPMVMEIDSTFTASGVLDELTVTLRADGIHPVRLHGERFHADFSFTLDAGTRDRSFKIPLSEGGIISGALNPFGQLGDLQVGQRWRMQAFNPIAALTGFGNRFIPMVVEVTGEERINTESGVVDCLVVEAANAKAWIDKHGAVQAQEMTLPMLGALRVVRQSLYDEQARRQAKQHHFRSPKRNRG